MGIENLNDRGHSNIEDAHFIREKMIPVAFQFERWNVVVHQAYQAIELLIKGMICLTGHVPRVTHNTDFLIDELFSYVPPNASEVPSIPFVVYALVPDSRNGYGVWLYGTTIEIAKVVHGITSVMTHFPLSQDLLRADAILRLGLEVKNFTVRLMLDNDQVLALTDASLIGPFTLRREFVRQPSKAKVEVLKELGRKLRTNRESSFYSERDYALDEAEEAIRLYDDANAVAACFLVEEH